MHLLTQLCQSIVIRDCVTIGLCHSYYVAEFAQFKMRKEHFEKYFRGQQELTPTPENQSHTSVTDRSNEGVFHMAVPRSRRGTGATPAAEAPAVDPAQVAAGINLSALPSAPNGVPPALNLAIPPAGAPALNLGVPAAAVDLGPVNARIDALTQQVSQLGASLQAAISSLASLVNDTYARLGEVAEAVEGLYEPEEGATEAPTTPQQVADAKPPKGGGKKGAAAGPAADTFADVPMQDALKPVIPQLNGHPAATAAASLVQAMATHGHPGIDAGRVTAWLHSIGVVDAAGNISA